CMKGCSVFWLLRMPHGEWSVWCCHDPGSMRPDAQIGVKIVAGHEHLPLGTSYYLVVFTIQYNTTSCAQSARHASINRPSQRGARWPARTRQKVNDGGAQPAAKNFVV